MNALVKHVRNRTSASSAFFAVVANPTRSSSRATAAARASRRPAKAPSSRSRRRSLRATSSRLVDKTSSSLFNAQTFFSTRRPSSRSRVAFRLVAAAEIGVGSEGCLGRGGGGAIERLQNPLTVRSLEIAKLQVHKGIRLHTRQYRLSERPIFACCCTLQVASISLQGRTARTPSTKHATMVFVVYRSAHDTAP